MAPASALCAHAPRHRFSASSTPAASIGGSGSSTPVADGDELPLESESWYDAVSEEDEVNLGPDFQAVIPHIQRLSELPGNLHCGGLGHASLALAHSLTHYLSADASDLARSGTLVWDPSHADEHDGEHCAAFQSMVVLMILWWQ